MLSFVVRYSDSGAGSGFIARAVGCRVGDGIYAACFVLTFAFGTEHELPVICTQLYIFCIFLICFFVDGDGNKLDFRLWVEVVLNRDGRGDRDELFVGWPACI